MRLGEQHLRELGLLISDAACSSRCLIDARREIVLSELGLLGLERVDRSLSTELVGATAEAELVANLPGDVGYEAHLLDLPFREDVGPHGAKSEFACDAFDTATRAQPDDVLTTAKARNR